MSADERIYEVVLNHEEQYSIWPAGEAVPAGWSAAGVSGPKEDCLDHIAEVWTDLRPLSLRKHMSQLTEGGVDVVSQHR